MTRGSLSLDVALVQSTTNPLKPDMTISVSCIVALSYIVRMVYPESAIHFPACDLTTTTSGLLVIGVIPFESCYSSLQPIKRHGLL